MSHRGDSTSGEDSPEAVRPPEFAHPSQFSEGVNQDTLKHLPYEARK